MYESLNSLISGLNQTGIWFGPYAFAMLIQSSILIVLLLGLDLLLRKHTRAVFRYCMWLLVLVKLILPPGWDGQGTSYPPGEDTVYDGSKVERAKKGMARAGLTLPPNVP